MEWWGAGKGTGRHWGDEEGKSDWGWEERGVSGEGEQRSWQAAFSVCLVNEKTWCPSALEAHASASLTAEYLKENKVLLPLFKYGIPLLAQDGLALHSALSQKYSAFVRDLVETDMCQKQINLGPCTKTLIWPYCRFNFFKEKKSNWILIPNVHFFFRGTYVEYT